MAVKIRLARAGAKKAPFYRLVAADSRSPRDGRFIEILGRYNPRTDPSTIEIDIEKVDVWLAKGAQMTETAAKLVKIARDPEAAAPSKEAKPSRKAAAKVVADAAAADKAVKEAADAKAKAAEEAAAAKAAAAEAAEEPAAEEAADEAPAEAVEEPAAEVAEEPAAPAEAEEPAVEEAADEAPAEDAVEDTE